MQLIVNADDFGFTRGVNFGIAESCNRGIVRSTTVMAGMPATGHAAEIIKQCPQLKTGVHLRLTAGAPMAEHVPSLCAIDGQFQKEASFRENHHMNADEIEQELRAQIESILELGFEISHFDGHHHCHTHEQVNPVARKLAKEYNVPLRPCTQPINYKFQKITFSDAFYGKELTAKDFLNIVKQHLTYTDVLEIMTHPALLDEELLNCSGYALPRIRELSILTNPNLHRELELMKVSVTNYHEL